MLQMLEDLPPPPEIGPLESATVLKSLVGVVADLHFVARASELLLKVWDDDEGGVLVRGLWSSALIAYGRCFKSGRRLRVPIDALDVLTDDERAIHESVLRERDKHVAHQVNELERTQASVLIESDGQKYRVAGVVVLMAKQIGPTREAVAQLRTIAEKLQTEAQGRVDVLQKKVMEDAQEKLDARAQMEVSLQD